MTSDETAQLKFELMPSSRVYMQMWYDQSDTEFLDSIFLNC